VRRQIAWSRRSTVDRVHRAWEFAALSPQRRRGDARTAEAGAEPRNTEELGPWFVLAIATVSAGAVLSKLLPRGRTIIHIFAKTPLKLCKYGFDCSPSRLGRTPRLGTDHATRTRGPWNKNYRLIQGLPWKTHHPWKSETLGGLHLHFAPGLHTHTHTLALLPWLPSPLAPPPPPPGPPALGAAASGGGFPTTTRRMGRTKG
jgi:hypothetical protein